jgi:serine/threonine-protein kinase
MVNDPLIGRQLGNFRIERLVGSGGMAQVYYGWDVVLERPVAIKVIARRFRHNESYTERFLREARAVARWRHEHIVHIYYAGEEDGLYYLAMEYVDGSDLAQVLAAYRAERRLPPHGEVVRIGRDIASALDFAHDRGIIHRDVKPSNVLITAEGRVLLSDFGLVLDRQEGSSGEVLGSPGYVAPEQALRSASAVPQSDLYSLGVILYEMLVGRLPFDDPSATALALQHVTEPPPPPRRLNRALNQATSDVLLKALEKKPENRFQTGAQLMEALSDALGVEATTVSFADAPLMPGTPGIARDATPTDPHPLRSTPGQRPAAREPRRPTPTPRHATPPPVVAVGRRPSRSRWSNLLWMGLGFVFFFALGSVLLFLIFRPDGLGSGTPEPPAAGEQPTGEVGAGETPQPDPEGEQPPPEEEEDGPPASGRPLQLFYNESSFYVHNPGSGTISTADLEFQALTASGEPAGLAFDGNRWAVYYPSLEPGNCVRLTLLGLSGHLSPGQCNAYNAIVTLEPQDSLVFWTQREGVEQFRVLWQGEEVGQCPIDVQSCEVTLP